MTGGPLAAGAGGGGCDDAGADCLTAGETGRAAWRGAPGGFAGVDIPNKDAIRGGMRFKNSAIIAFGPFSMGSLHGIQC